MAADPTGSSRSCSELGSDPACEAPRRAPAASADPQNSESIICLCHVSNDVPTIKLTLITLVVQIFWMVAEMVADAVTRKFGLVTTDIGAVMFFFFLCCLKLYLDCNPPPPDPQMSGSIIGNTSISDVVRLMFVCMSCWAFDFTVTQMFGPRAWLWLSCLLSILILFLLLCLNYMKSRYGAGNSAADGDPAVNPGSPRPVVAHHSSPPPHPAADVAAQFDGDLQDLEKGKEHALDVGGNRDIM